MCEELYGLKQMTVPDICHWDERNIMDHPYYLTPKEFMTHLESAAREAYFTGDEWDKKTWHPEDIASNLEAVLAAIRGYTSSIVWHSRKWNIK